MKPRVIFIHGNGAMHWSFAWAPWLKRSLEERGYATAFETFPDSVIARSQYWLPFLQEHLHAGGNDVLIGWSSGAVAAMRYAETTRIRGSMLVAPSHTDMGDALERQSGYFDTPWDWDAIKANQDHITLVHSDNDPFIPLAETQHIAQQLDPEVLLVPGAGHFIERDAFPELLASFTRTY